MSSANDSIVRLALSVGLSIDPDSLRFNETGLDFQVVFAADAEGRAWVLRIPRRPDAASKAQLEARALRLFAPFLPVKVPDWQVFDATLIAYPLLDGEPGLTFDPETHEVTWNFDRQSPAYAKTLGAAIAALHAVIPSTAGEVGLPVHSPDTARQRLQQDIKRVAGQFEVPAARLARWQAWISDDSYWPPRCVPVHGDLYAGHVLVRPDGTATGIIDWTEARVDDPALDFAGHIRAFGEDALPELMAGYEAAGGRLWPRFVDHCRQLNGFHAVEYAKYALTTGDPAHVEAAQAQLSSPD
ncbi:macrolide 2'-phosphotransferase [Glycocaulis sp.]|uniref:macrolide 2'-phosphotransferase n=1 Tax=Glycocaulis sp. TaxID=1969725 RepID=UPI003D1B40EA